MQLNGSQIFVEVLCEQGVDTLFGYPGGAVLNLYDELYKNADRITHVLTAHEQGASHAADGYARATGRTGVVLATSGRLYGLCADGGFHRQCDHGGPGQGRLPGSLHRGHHDAHHQAQLHGAPSRRPGRHHACGFPHRPERPQRPGAGGHPEGCHRCGL